MNSQHALVRSARAHCSILVEKSTFHSHIRSEERVLNQGAISQYNPITDETHWLVRDQLVGLSLGRIGASRAYFIPFAS